MNFFDDKKSIFEYFKETEIEIEKSSPLEVTIKNGQLDVNKIVEYKGETIKKFEYRPTTFENFIGQEEAKERLKTIEKKIKQGLKGHFLVDGIKGHGKSTIVKIFSKRINAHLIERIGKQINEDNLIDIINEINISKTKNVILFIDEIDSMDWKTIKVLNPIIESFEIAGKKIKPFIFASATINKHILIKNNPDTLDRIPTHIKFKRYNTIEIIEIVSQYIKEMDYSNNLNENALIKIGENCKYNPRTAIALLEEYVVEQDINKVLKNCRIVKNGLTEIDIKLLQILNEANRPIGANALAIKCGLSQAEYIQEFESYLVEYGYINRVPSRIITEKGKQLLEKLK